MTIIYKGGARVPGPLGFTAGGVGGRVPGPLGFRSLVVAQSGVTKAAPKSLAMPPPSKTSTMMAAHKVGWKLFDGKPGTTDVRQGQLATCPIASILAALAHTSWGQERIKSLIKEKTAAVVKTTLSADTLKEIARHFDDPSLYQAQAPEVISDRYFEVALKSPAIEVSDVFYIEYTESKSRNPTYMQARPQMAPDKAKEVLWPAVIEKAYAHMVGSYEKLDEYGPKGVTVDVYWTTVVGSRPETITINADTDHAKIRAAAMAASRIPAIGASKETTTNVMDKHGLALMGMQGPKIELYDPWGKTVRLTLDEFVADFDLILRKA